MKSRIILLWAVMSLWAAGALHALTMTASVDKTNLSLDDELTLTVEVRGANGNMLMPQLPSLPAFNVYSREVSTMNINGQASTLFRYVMLPRFATKATIGPIRFTHNGQVYTTQPIEINIYRRMPAGRGAGGATQTATAAGSGRNYDSAVAAKKQNAAGLPDELLQTDSLANDKAGEDFFMTAAVSSRSPYVNQQIELIIRFYYAQPFVDQAPYFTPTVTNIFMEPLKQNVQGSQVLKGRMYRYVERRYALSGVQPGKAEIGSAMVKYRPGSDNFFSVFDHFFGGAAVGEERVVKTQPITLNVRPTPQAGQPDSFYGAVGTNFSISAKADHTAVEAGEAINLTVTVKGLGNLKSTADLKLPAIPGFKVYDVSSNATAIATEGGTQSTKTFSTIIVPAASGEYIIPKINWSYFNSKTGKYITLSTRPITVKVSPSTKTSKGVNFAGGGTTDSGFKQLGKDIRYLKTESYTNANSWLKRLGQLKILNGLFILLPILCGAGILVGKKSLRAKRPLMTARQQLKKAVTVEQIALAAEDFLLSRFHINTGSRQLRGVLEDLQKRGVQVETLKEFAALWQRLDAARFAPQNMAAADSQALAGLALEIFKRLDAEGR